MSLNDYGFVTIPVPEIAPVAPAVFPLFAFCAVPALTLPSRSRGRATVGGEAEAVLSASRPTHIISSRAG